MTKEEKQDLINAFEIKHDCSVCAININDDNRVIEISAVPNKSMKIFRLSEKDAQDYIKVMKLKRNETKSNNNRLKPF